MHGNADMFFPYSIFSQQIAIASLQKAFANKQGLLGVQRCWFLGPVLYFFFYVKPAMIGRYITNHSLEKKKAPGFDFNFLS